MQKVRIYQKSIIITSENLTLNKRNFHYINKVLRLKINDIITIFNGDGFDYEAKIVQVSLEIIIEILNKNINNSESKIDITLIQAIGKGDKMDFIIQKAVELGVSKIIPIITKRTIFKLKDEQRQLKKVAKWQEIVINSCEQCGRSVVPKVTNIINFTDLKLGENTYILDPNAHKNLMSMQKSTKINLIIGPEGGLDELELDNEYIKLSLGNRILRTETASIACLANIEMLWG